MLDLLKFHDEEQMKDVRETLERASFCSHSLRLGKQLLLNTLLNSVLPP